MHVFVYMCQKLHVEVRIVELVLSYHVGLGDQATEPSDLPRLSPISRPFLSCSHRRHFVAGVSG